MAEEGIAADLSLPLVAADLSEGPIGRSDRVIE